MKCWFINITFKHITHWANEADGLTSISFPIRKEAAFLRLIGNHRIKSREIKRWYTYFIETESSTEIHATDYACYSAFVTKLTMCLWLAYPLYALFHDNLIRKVLSVSFLYRWIDWDLENGHIARPTSHLVSHFQSSCVQTFVLVGVVPLSSSRYYHKECPRFRLTRPHLRWRSFLCKMCSQTSVLLILFFSEPL